MSPQQECGDTLAVQVLLDRHGFSVGEIDGRAGANTRRALSAFQHSRGLLPAGVVDCATFESLGGATAAVTSEFVLTEADVAGPHVADIPTDLMAQAALPALGYRSVLERLGERFHASPDLLKALNPGATFAAGAVIVVPAVEPFDPDARPAPAPAPHRVRVEVRRDEGALRVFGEDGGLLFFAPVTLGSERDPLPLGDWKVLGIGWMPAFHYNPALFWDADPSHARAIISPGPNNPVGVVWIDIDVDHYGLHGTPEPSRVGHTTSHGCVRLANWDAARVAALVGPGTPVVFR